LIEVIGSAVCDDRRLMLEPVTSTRCMLAESSVLLSVTLCAPAACMPNSRPLAQMTRNDRDSNFSIIMAKLLVNNFL